MSLVKLFLLCCLVLSWFCGVSVIAQSVTTVDQLFERIPKYRPDANTNLDVSQLSKAGFYQLIDQLYRIDQQYRHQYEDCKNPASRSELMRRIKINDEANQQLLLKGLRVFDWPTDYNPAKPGFNSRSWKAWSIVHHTSNVAPQLAQQLRPYITAAYQKKSFSREFWQLYRSSHP